MEDGSWAAMQIARRGKMAEMAQPFIDRLSRRRDLYFTDPGEVRAEESFAVFEREG